MHTDSFKFILQKERIEFHIFPLKQWKTLYFKKKLNNHLNENEEGRKFYSKWIFFLRKTFLYDFYSSIYLLLFHFFPIIS